MNYKERIKALKELKSSLKDVDNKLTGVNSDISGWEGGDSKSKYQDYIQEVKNNTEMMLETIDSFKSEISKLISEIQRKFDEEYRLNMAVIKMIHEDNPSKTKQKRREKLNSLRIDSSVKEKIRQNL